MSLPADTVPVRLPGALYAKVRQDFILLDPTGTTLRGLNASAARIWDLIDGRRALGEIAQAVADTWHLALDRAERDVGSFLEQLDTRQLIRLNAAGKGP